MSIATAWMAAALAVALFATYPSAASAQSQTTAQQTHESLPDFSGREETFGYCVGCHSFAVVGRQGMDRGRWDDTLNWMAEKHGMPVPDPVMRKLVLDYLAQAYPTKVPSRTGGWINPFAPKP